MRSDSSKSNNLTAAESMQRSHYDRITDGYQQHYGDAWSLAYRRDFMLAPMIQGVDITGLHILDAMCGSGESTSLLIEAGARVTGLDISGSEIEKFRIRFPHLDAHCGSILNTGLPAASFDGVCVFGGLHHLHPHLNQAIGEIHRILKPGGFFIFTEPHAGALPDLFRSLWYRFDPLFMDNEKSVDIAAMKSTWNDQFHFEVESYAGSTAYLLVLNSMVFRFPHHWKAWINQPARRIEQLLQPLLGRRFSCYVNCRWRKSTA